MTRNQGSPGRKDKGYEMVNVETNDDKPKTLKNRLVEAARAGNLENLHECLDQGEDIFQVDGSFSASVLHYAVHNDNFENAIQCTEELLTRALLNFNVEGLKRLIEKQDGIQETPLFWALAKGNHIVVQMLLNRGASLGFTRSNESAFHVVAKLENHNHALNCAEVLLDAKYYDSEDALKKYLNTEELNTSRTALHRAAMFGNHTLVQLLVYNGADVARSDFLKCNVFHHAVGNVLADETWAVKCVEILMQNKLTDDWDKIRHELLYSFSIRGKCPIHIAARRGFSKILEMMPAYFLVAEGQTGFTALHSCASLGSQTKAEECVQQILNSVLVHEKTELLNLEDANGCTPLYLAAKHKNIEAAKLLLLEGSAFDVKSKRGKTPLEEVYEKVPQAIDVLLNKAIANSAYVASLGSVSVIAELDFGPILGYGKSKVNLYKESQELAKVCYAKFEDRKTVLNHILVRIFIHLKWERVKGFFVFFRLLHILWFLYNCFFLVSMYRVECPYRASDAKPYSWTSLRPAPTRSPELNDTKSLEECDISSALHIGGSLNLFALAIYLLSQLHQTIQNFHWIFRPMKPFKAKASFTQKALKTISYYPMLLLRILPCWPLVLSTGLIITTLPALGIVPFDETSHYIIAGLMGLFIWLAIYLELGKFPKFRVYINLLMRSTRTLLLAIAVTAPILFGFANVFVILIPGEPSFSSAAQSFVKVITFMIGELDYQGLFYGEKESVFLGIVMLALAVFVVIIVVLLVNFLIGLAAEEIRDFWERAEIWKLCTQLEQIVMLESFLDETIPGIGREFLKENLMLMPPDKEGNTLQQIRVARIDIPLLPKEMQKELHELNLRTIEDVR